jgi:hypothetical protein
VIACVIPEDHSVRSPVPVLLFEDFTEFLKEQPHREVVRVDLHEAKVDLAVVVQRQNHGDSRGDSGALLGVELFLRLPCPPGVVAATHPGFVNVKTAVTPLDVVEYLLRALLS